MTDFSLFRDRFAEACRARGVAKGRIVTNPIGRKRKYEKTGTLAVPRSIADSGSVNLGSTLEST